MKWRKSIVAQKKYKLEILAPARSEILEIARLHMELAGPESARKITSKLKDALEHLRTHPYMGIMLRDKALQAEGYRMLICGSYLCIYKPLGDTVFVYHIVDGRSNYPSLFSDLPK
jgi:plasmid stabilization system protein ParE